MSGLKSQYLLTVMAIGLLFVYNIRQSLGGRQMFAALFVFIVGSIPIIASTIRYSTIYFILRDPLSAFSRFADIEAWSEIDCAFATYAACLPALRSMIRKNRSHTASYSIGHRYHQSGRVSGTETTGTATTGTATSRRKQMWSREQGTLEGVPDQDVEQGGWVFATPPGGEPQIHDAANGPFNIYVTRDFDVAVDPRLSVPPLHPGTAIYSGPQENLTQHFNTFSKTTYSTTQHAQDLDDDITGSDVELKDLASPPARGGMVTPINRIDSERGQ